MNEIEFIQHPELKKVLKGYEKLNKEKQDIGYNLFTISSYTSHLEIFHFDIIHSLLNTVGLHKEKYYFLALVSIRKRKRLY